MPPCVVSRSSRPVTDPEGDVAIHMRVEDGFVKLTPQARDSVRGVGDEGSSRFACRRTDSRNASSKTFPLFGVEGARLVPRGTILSVP